MNILKKSVIFIIIIIQTITFLVCDDNIDDLILNENQYIEYPITITGDDPERTVYFKIPDTGQNRVILIGDDGSYTNIPDAINLQVNDNIYSNDDIVKDNITGLIWTKCSALNNNNMDTEDNCNGTHGLYTWDEAKSFCEGLVYGGDDDWRLPTASELFSIVNFDNNAPAIDLDFFPDTEGEPGLLGKYWTSTKTGLFALDFRWRINFNSIDGPDPDIPDPLFFLNFDEPDDEEYVRCVRGPE